MNMVFNAGMFALLKAGVTGFTFKVMMLRSTSTYTPIKAETTIANILATGGIEPTVASYARQALSSITTAQDNSLNRAWMDAANVSFGNLETGQSVGAFIIYLHTGSDDTMNIPWIYYDGLTSITTSVAFTPQSGVGFTVISNITNANPGVVTTSSPHSLNTGDYTYITSVVGMTQVNNVEFQITNVTSTTYSIGQDTTGYANYVSNGISNNVTLVPIFPAPYDIPVGALIGLPGQSENPALSKDLTRLDILAHVCRVNANVAANVIVSSIQTALVLPIAFGGGAFNTNFPSAGVLEVRRAFGS